MDHKEQLNELKKASEQDLPAALKHYLEESEKLLKEEHAKNRYSGIAVCMKYTAVIDDLLAYIYEVKKKTTGFTESAALVAVGGYGRGELNIRSDIDLILMHRGKVTPGLKSFTEAMLYLLYDTGLDLGFAMRTPEECVSLARTDLNTMTSLLERRFIRGEKALYRESTALIKKKLFVKKRISGFIEDKIAETEKRYSKYGGSVFILEPNVKEGEGGLRDLHSARWILMARDGAAEKPFTMGLISESNQLALEKGLEFLLWIRNELHFESVRKSDQLTFDHQVRIAYILGFKDTEKSLAVESFMQEYYAYTSDIHNAYEHIISRYAYEKRKAGRLWPAGKKKLDQWFHTSKGWLSYDETHPLTFPAIVQAFQYISKEGLQLNQHTKDSFIEYLGEAGEGFSITEETARSFLVVLGSSAPYEALSAMHALGLLGILIPEFNEVRHKTQHDLYHVYTVDTHSLFAVRELERLLEVNADEFPRLSSIYRDIPHRGPLVLATLLHDIGKAAGKDHAERGAELVPVVAKRLHIPRDQTDLIQFLLKKHLLLANTALYRDIHDEKLLRDLAAEIGSVNRLNHLYLLTFADVRSVGPEVWTRWKGMLFAELYMRLRAVLEEGITAIEVSTERIERIKEGLRGLIEAGSDSLSGAEAFLDLLPERYFLVNSEERILEQLAVLSNFGGSKSHVISISQEITEAYTSLIICTLDRQGLFAMISGVMAGNGIDILGAQITTLKNGLVIDVLQVTNTSGLAVIDEFKRKKIDKDLGNVISGRVAVKSLIRKKPSILDGRHRATPVSTVVSIDNSISDAMSVIDINTENKPGLLYDITNAIAELGLYINIARISTKGSKATDIFYVKDIFGQKVYGEKKLNKIKNTIYEAIEGKKKKKQRAGEKASRPGRGGSAS
ncbi:MAG: [protein-PII] uridylyltransferase [Thermodesulfobacteriota bacterium]